MDIFLGVCGGILMLASAIILLGLPPYIIGYKESKLSKLADVCIRVPETETYKIQELHLPVYHCLCMMLEEHFFSNEN